VSLTVALLGAFCVLLWPHGGSNGIAAVQPRDRFPDLLATQGSMGMLRRRRRGSLGGDVLGLVEAIAPGLESGLAPAAALSLAAESTKGSMSGDPAGDLADRMADLARDGRPLGPAWAQAADANGSAELRLLSHAWALTEDNGAPLADAVRTTAALLRARMAQQRRLAAAVAGARATMRVLTLLPLGGPVLALMLGIGPRELYGQTVLSQLCLAAGFVLMLLGRWWVRRMVEAVSRGQVVA